MKHVVRHYCSDKCKADFQKSAKPVSYEWLHNQYVTNGLDCVQIGKLVNRDPKSVWLWLKDFGIPTRKRGHASPKPFKKGEPSRFKGKKHTEENKFKMSMHAKAEGRVPYDPAVGSYMKGRKGAETTNWRGGISPLRQAFYATPEWRSVSRKVRIRDRFTCQHCGLNRNEHREVPFDIHHIVSFECPELRAEITNLVYLCEPCHYWVHSKKNTEKKFIVEYSSLASRVQESKSC